MVVAIVANIILAWLSRFKYLFLSGHILFYLSLMVASVMYAIGLDFVNNNTDYAIALTAGSLFLAVYMVLSPRLQQRYVRLIVKSDQIAIANSNGFAYALTGLIGEIIA
ncbi:PTS transporter subunit IIC [[Mycoplasma] cavipharyngis]|uniref:PTS transporter subunit IIC n=1 Tax=[Mycoplasma] cavipharyngis TaxID=92757 RepID=UPI0037040674